MCSKRRATGQQQPGLCSGSSQALHGVERPVLVCSCAWAGQLRSTLACQDNQSLAGWDGHALAQRSARIRLVRLVLSEQALLAAHQQVGRTEKKRLIMACKCSLCASGSAQTLETLAWKNLAKLIVSCRCEPKHWLQQSYSLSCDSAPPRDEGRTAKKALIMACRCGLKGSMPVACATMPMASVARPLALRASSSYIQEQLMLRSSGDSELPLLQSGQQQAAVWQLDAAGMHHNADGLNCTASCTEGLSSYTHTHKPGQPLSGTFTGRGGSA